MNRVFLSGRLTRDPEVRYGLQSGKANARMTLAVQRPGKHENGEQSADFISLVAFDKRAEFCRDYLKQGTKIIVSGRINTGSYVNKDGNRVYTTDVMADEIEFAESKGAGAASTVSKSSDAESDAGDGFMEIPDGGSDELPFK